MIWSKGGVKLPDNKILLGNIMILADVDIRDRGTYKCSERQFGWLPVAKKSFNLYIGRKYFRILPIFLFS